MGYDDQKLQDVTLALLGACEFDGGRVWKRHDFGIMDALHARGLITDPRGRQESVYLTLGSTGRSPFVWQDLSGVVPALAWDWVRYFTYLAAQQRSWTEASLRAFTLRLRNLIAIGGKVTPEMLAALKEAKAIEFQAK